MTTTTSPQRPAMSLRFHWPLTTGHWPLILLLLVGCSREIETDYGQRHGAGASTSVNGTAVLAEMFKKAGHRVFSWNVLSPRLRSQADCIVWFPDDFDPPTLAVQNWLEDWLLAKRHRTLIYVGRDFDAAAWYWRRISLDASPEQKKLIGQQLENAVRRFTLQRNAKPTTTPPPEQENDEPWFDTEDAKPRSIRTLDADCPWARGINASRLDIELKSRMKLSDTAQKLLASHGDAIVGREAFNDSQLILVANGSFLLNLPLVNHEHRRLAGKLIDQVGPPKKTVVFLESSAGGPSIRDTDPTAADSSGLEIFNEWPTNWILIHVAVVGVLFCFARWPIFGIAKEERRLRESDFGRHIDALADMLERTGDKDFAMDKITNFRGKTQEKK